MSSYQELGHLHRDVLMSSFIPGRSTCDRTV